ncbi:MAG: hypothetical protein IJ680_02430 [Paludibacteraceae bacterium]|nr:hypothetical protein [Paludibacteraceae bacterium]
MKQTLSHILTILAFCAAVSSCGHTTENGGEAEENAAGTTSSIHPANDKSGPECWNISIYLDLSDRLIKGQGEPQSEPQMLRDTAIITHLSDMFVEHVAKNRIVPCKDKFQVFFYPTDGIPNASAISKKLTLDLENVAPQEKKHIVKNWTENIRQNITPIYSTTLDTKKWLGSDIWGFFKNKIKISTVRPNCRNILVILTDGYIFHEHSKIKQGANEYSYILSQNIGIKDMKLIPCNKDLDNLEVLFVEINPTQFSHGDLMQHIIGTWLEEMGVKHYDIIQTDVSSNILPGIDNFIKQ